MSELFGNPESAPQQAPTPQASTNDPVTPAQPEPKPAESLQDPNSLFADQLAAIKAEDGRQKYADVPTALSAIPHANATIQQLKADLEATRAELQQKKGIEEMIERMEASKNPAAINPPVIAGLDEEAVGKLFEAKLQQRQQAELQESNRQSVVNKLTEKFGDKAEEVFKARAVELGMDTKQLSELALRHPQMVLSQFGEVKAPSAQPVSGTVNAFGMPKAAVDRKPVAFGATTKQMVEQFRNHAQPQ